MNTTACIKSTHFLFNVHIIEFASLFYCITLVGLRTIRAQSDLELFLVSPKGPNHRGDFSSITAKNNMSGTTADFVYICMKTFIFARRSRWNIYISRQTLGHFSGSRSKPISNLRGKHFGIEMQILRVACAKIPLCHYSIVPH